MTESNAPLVAVNDGGASALPITAWAGPDLAPVLAELGDRVRMASAGLDELAADEAELIRAGRVQRAVDLAYHAFNEAMRGHRHADPRRNVLADERQTHRNDFTARLLATVEEASK